MNHSEKIDLLTKALIEAEGEYREIKLNKTAKAGQFSFKYADLAEIFNATKPALRKAGLKSMGFFETKEGELYLTMMLMHVSGQWMKSSIKVSTASSKPTELGSFITYMRRYLYSTLLGITAEEDVEGDALNATVDDSDDLSQDQKEELLDLMAKLDEPQKAAEYFRKAYNIWDLTKVSKKQHAVIISTLKKRIAKEEINGSAAMA